MSFDIHLDFPPKGLENDDCVANVRIAAHGHLLTQILEMRYHRYRDSFRASVVSLAFWFADNWWRLRYEPLGAPSLATIDWRLRHEMSSGSADELWPSIMIYGGGPRVMLASTLGTPRDEPGIRYLPWQPLSMLGKEYEDGVDALFEQVLGNCARYVDAEAFKVLIGQLDIERKDEALAGWRRLEACLGFDPDKAPDRVVEAMTAYEEQLGAESVEEAAIAAPGQSAPATLQTVLAAAGASNIEIDLSLIAKTAAEIDDPYGQTPWRAAEDAAMALRDALALPDIIKNDTLGGLLQTRWSDLKAATATARDLPYAVRVPSTHDRSHVALKMVPQVDRRFELARIIGDSLWTRGGGLGVVSRARSDRQKYQRAFAQALLCPMRSLAKMIDLDNPTEAQIDHAARRHNVRDKVIETILVNRGILVRDDYNDQLEAA
ncbi:hypothetical protein [Sphingomonas sp. PB4P5]|uniref:hypothetical protein n=1 Tax=Parasphingomonas puruogangriensis TaxID=3096155 RepID=UPI002FCCA55A